jgi:NTP pyrophosphatase (non-canonical NTP hydrolase)
VDPNEYQKLALVTEARVDAETFVSRARDRISTVIEAIVQLGKYADAEKRTAFYGKPTGVHQDTEQKILDAVQSLTSDYWLDDCVMLADANTPPHTIRKVHAVLGLISEIGEVAETCGREERDDAENIAEECGDVLWYIAVLLDAYGLSLNDVMEQNIAKLKTRYGAKFTEAAAVARADKNRL